MEITAVTPHRATSQRNSTSFFRARFEISISKLYCEFLGTKMVASENTVTSQWALVMYAADFSLGGYQCTLSFISTMTSSCLPVSENLTVFLHEKNGSTKISNVPESAIVTHLEEWASLHLAKGYGIIVGFFFRFT